jgi:glutamyl-tRNA(Gln) amidotransferase subunit E
VRQDVNVSISGGTRVEIKGVPQIGMIEALCRTEGYRQKALLDLRYALRHSDLTAEDFSADYSLLEGRERELAAESSGIDPASDSPMAAKRLRGFARYLEWETQPGRTFLDEIRGRVRVIACLEADPAVAEAPRSLREAMGIPDEDGLLLFTGPEEDLETASKEIAIRISEAFEGVPSETRQALPGGNTAFERILPGPDRMYPDTDLPPEPIDLDMLERVRSDLPPAPWERRETYSALGVSDQLIYRLINWDRADMFDRLSSTTEFRPSELAYLLTDRLRGSRRAGHDWLALGEDRIVKAVGFCDSAGVTLKAAASLLDRLAEAPDTPLADALEAVKPRVLSG